MATVRSLQSVIDAPTALAPGTHRAGSDASALIDALTQVSIDDLLDSVGLARFRHGPLRQAFRPAARRFARIAHEFDGHVGEDGLARGGQWMIDRMTGGLQTVGLDDLPAAGPLFVLANHPGIADTVALFASLAMRPDLKVIALDRPFLRALPNVANKLLFLPDDEAGRSAVLRAGVRHLQQGGALLTFPAGEIEPDPATFGAARALDSLQQWSSSYTLFARRVPQTLLIPALVSDVVSAHAQRHPLTRLRRSTHDREKFGAALQVVFSRYRHGVARVAFGKPISVGSSEQARTEGGRQLAAAVVDGMRALIAEREQQR